MVRSEVRTFPLNVVGPDSRPLQLVVEVFDQEAWDKLSEAAKKGAMDDAMMYGRIELHKRMPIATITRVGDSRLQGGTR